MATIYTKAIQEMYVAYFNRPADVAGLAFWEGVVAASGGDTAAVSAAFSNSAEYKAEYEDLNVTGTLRQIYRNLFNDEADAAGLAFWANAVSTGAVSIDKAVTSIAAGAQGVHATTFANKVTVATAFTAALDTDAEKAGYTGELANEAAKAYLATITTNASVTAALVPATLAASVAGVIKAGVEFTVAGALATFDAAVDARTAFLAAADGDGKATTSLTVAKLEADIDAAQLAIGDADVTVDGDTGIAGYNAATSDGVKAALLADEVELRAETLAAAQTTLAAQTVKVNAVVGLSSAIAMYNAAEEALESANDVAVAAKATQDGAEATYEGLNGNVAITIDPVTGAVANVLVVSGTGAAATVALAAGVTEATNPGVTALLAAVKANLVAVKAATAATNAFAKADVTLDRTDVTAGSEDELIAVGQAFTVKLAAGVAPTPAQIEAEYLSLQAKIDAAKAVVTAAGANVTPAQTAAVTTAENNYAAFDAKVDAFDAADTANPVSTAYFTAQDAVELASASVDVLDAELADLAELEAIATELANLDDAIAAAGEVFADNDFAAPVTLSTAAVAGTAAADIFVAGTTNSTILNFGADDLLFIGSEYTINTGALSTGNNAVLEAFVAQSGLNTVITLETKAFGSASADAEIVITLTGVNVADVTFANGIISI